MAENVVINIEANTSGLQQTIDLMVKLGLVTEDAAKKFKSTNDQTMTGLNKAATETKKSFDSVAKAIDNVKKDNGLAKALDVTKDVTKVGNGLASLKAQFAAAKNEAQSLAAEIGNNLDPRVLAAAEKASELAQQIEDTNRVIKALDPGEKFRTIQNFGAAIGGVFQVATGALQAFGVENETATKLAQQFQGALNVTAGLQQLIELKDTFEALKAALGLTTAATAAQTAAGEGLAASETKQAAAATGAAGAQKGLNAAMLANPYVAVAAGLAVVVGALILFASNADSAKQKYEDLAGSVALNNIGFDAQLRAVNRQEKEVLSYYDRLIATARLEGKTVQEIGELEKEKLKKQQDFIILKIKTNNDGIDSDQAAYDNALKLNTEEGAQLRQELLDRIAARKEANLELKSQQNILKDDYIVLEKTITKQVDDENKKRKESSKKANEEVAKSRTQTALPDSTKYSNAIGLINQYYKEQELLILKSGKTEEEMSKAMTQNQIDQLTDQITAAKLYFQDYTQLEITLQNLINKRDKLPEIPVKVSAEVSEMPNEVKDILGKIDQLTQEINDSLIDSGGTIIKSYFDQYVEGLTYATEQQKDALDQQEKDLQESYNNRLIGRIELEQKEQEIALKKAALERKLKTDQAKADRSRALFDVAINTASAIVRAWVDPGFPAAIPLVPYIVGLGAIQAGTILAQPLPKYKRGTLSVPGIGNEDTHPALLTPGEAVIPKDTNAKYRDAIGAIYHGKISPGELNSFVRMKLKNDYSSKHGASGGSVTARMDTADLYTLGKMMKRNDGVVIKNVGELATIFASLHNPRR